MYSIRLIGNMDSVTKIVYPRENDAEDLANGANSLGEFCIRQLKLIGNNVALVTYTHREY